MSAAIPIDGLGGWLSEVVDSLEVPLAQKPLQEWSQQFAGDIGKGFLSSESPTGHKWPPLKRKRPPGHNSGTRPLIDFGNLMLSLISDGEGHIEVITGDTATFGTRVDYARYHQDGTRLIPQREFLDVNDDQATLAAELVGEHLVERIERL